MVHTSTLKRLLILPFALGIMAFATPLTAQDAVEGEKLFSENCTSCHVIDGPKGIGPNLRDVNARRKPEWLLKWVKNSTKVIESGDPIATKLFEENNKVSMTSFEYLADNQIKSILKYIETAPVATATAAVATTATSEGSTTAALPMPANAAGGFYNNATMLVLLILAIVLIVIGILLSRVKGMMQVMLSNKFPDDANLTPKPSFYESKFLPWLKDLNPTIATLVIVLIVGVIGGGAYFKFANEEIGVQQGYAPTQPIAFDHSIHAGEYKIDCQFCHSSASFSKQATVPSLNTCMNCHKSIDAAAKYNGEVSPEIQKIRTAYKDNTPIRWVRIHNLPDHVYFNHSQHVTVGKLECQTCHGPIETMKKVEQFSSLQMGWCVNCHREAKVDFAGNNYYEELHTKLKAMGRKALTVEQNGGLECGKCHY
jgi:mono/diheme cytochrome c family protein